MIRKIKLHNGKEVIIRYPTINDINELTRYINKLSKEDTFILFSGEVVKREDEEKFLQGTLEKIKNRDEVFLVCELNGKIIGSSSICRDLSKKERAKHIGQFGISLARDYRHQGLGKELMKIILDEAKKQIKGLRIFVLHIFGGNEVAMNLYKEMGFHMGGCIPGGILFHGQYVDYITMWKKI